MGQKLVNCYEWVKSNGGLQMQMRLAMKVGLSSQRAANEPDSPELIAKFQAACKELTGKIPQM